MTMTTRNYCAESLLEAGRRKKPKKKSYGCCFEISLCRRFRSFLRWIKPPTCATLKSIFQFIDKPLSSEEREYPLAYGVIVHKNAVQILFELSAFYHPQNEYCIAVSETAEKYVLEFMLSVEKCFPNVHVLQRPKIEWGKFEILNSTITCLKSLLQTGTKWRYFQYLSGIDAPMKTNLETVQILKQLNDTVNIYVDPFQRYRIGIRNETEPPLPLFKSPLSLLLPRRTAEELLSSPLTQEVLDFLVPTGISDESFWGTMLGNPAKFNVTGSFNASEMIEFDQKFNETDPQAYSDYTNASFAMNGYIARYQLWRKRQCKGMLINDSCVFGVEDLALLLKQHYLVAHKFYINYQPAAYFCLLKEIFNRTHSPAPFDTSIYAEIPLVEISRGVAISNLTHPEWFLKLHEWEYT
ncbi:hypothetical protein Q1695_014811 [Nippostrongylus brasiliensis]|nr:hypothetical protein Q1695_014811 [Nippostrongylus brasiliensis]